LAVETRPETWTSEEVGSVMQFLLAICIHFIKIYC